jgi:hypothetical protein
MKFDPATGEAGPKPRVASMWRDRYPFTAWLFNPWTGRRRYAKDVGMDVYGVLIEGIEGMSDE